MYYNAASLLLCTNFTWLCASFGAVQRKSWSAKEVFGRHGMAVGNHLINHRWFTKYYLPQIITSCSELFTYHGPNHQMILLHQSFRQFTPSEYLPAPASTDCVLSCKVLNLFWSLRCQFFNCFYTSKLSVPRAPLPLKGFSRVSSHGLVGKMKTYNQFPVGRATG